MSNRPHLFVTIAIFYAIFGAGVNAARAAEDYAVSFTGASGDLLDKLKILSDLEKRQRTYPTNAALRRAAERDTIAFADALKAAGYYSGKAGFELVPATEAEGAKVVFQIETGPAFKVTEYDILYRDEAEGRPTTLADANLKAEGSAAGAALRDLQISFLGHLWDSGYPAAEIVARRAIANMEKGTANAVFVFASGPKANFGEVVIDGADRTHPDYIRALKTWEVGDEYERSTMVRYRDRLAATGLFSTIDISPGAPNDSGAAPIYATLDERKRRTIGAGASISTAEGVGGRLFFENRNLFRRGETARVELRAANIEQSINFDIVKPLPRLPGQAFGNFEFSNETTDAFNARSIAVNGGLSKKWLEDRLETRGAVGLETSNVKADGEEERTYFISTPLSVVWNSENDLLNPTRGVQARWAVTPYTGSDTFTQTELSARSRITFGENDLFTLASRSAVGATFGSTLDDLPRNKRFYVGGAGSVRGFGFQEAGPLDAENDPIGGLSYIEAAIEARVKVTDTIQIAGFADAGSVSSSTLPDFDEQFFVGVGGGVRYFTPIGPIRADVAFPLNPRESDRNFQIFIAIGQPF
ncbi:MAG: BamA/TamA family outer membrane protein [Pseudomonadota bacterium]